MTHIAYYEEDETDQWRLWKATLHMLWYELTKTTPTDQRLYRKGVEGRRKLSLSSLCGCIVTRCFLLHLLSPLKPLLCLIFNNLSPIILTLPIPLPLGRELSTKQTVSVCWWDWGILCNLKRDQTSVHWGQSYYPFPAEWQLWFLWLTFLFHPLQVSSIPV